MSATTNDPATEPVREVIPTRQAAWTLWLGCGLPDAIANKLHSMVSSEALADGGRLFSGLADIADLLGSGTGAGRLVLSASSIPAEDVGILRRFLSRASGRELVIIADQDQPVSDELLVLPRTRPLPTHLSPSLVDHLLSTPERSTTPVAPDPAIVPPTESAGDSDASLEPSADRMSLAWQILRERLAGRRDLAPLLQRLDTELRRVAPEDENSTDELVDLGAVAEELLAGISLERDRRMRFLFRPEGELSMRTSRSNLELCLRSLFNLVGGCSSPDCVIRVRVTSTSGSEADPDSPVDTTIDFPDAPLAGLPLGSEIDPEVVARHIGPDVSAALRMLRSSASALGATLESLPTRPGRRRLRLRMPRLAEV